MSDDYRKVNPIIRKATKKIFDGRENFPVEYITDVRVETVNNAACCDVWFMTRGCSHDLRGGCTMCNYAYGKGFKFNDEEIINSLERQIAALPDKIEEIMLSPTGSIFDDYEVPRELRLRIFELFSKRHFKNFFTESRCDTLTREKLECLKNIIDADNIFVEVGVESCCEWILRNCVNKNLLPDEICKAVELVHDCGMNICANIAIGFPFLDESAGIISAIKSIKTALNMGFDSVVFFPYHVRPGTFLEFLWLNNFYHPCSLYSFCEVLKSLDEDMLPSVNISWYRNYYGSGSRKILASPQSCPICYEKILRVLDVYKNAPNINSLKGLDNINCECKHKWEMEIKSKAKNKNYEVIINQDLMLNVYNKIGEFCNIMPLELETELKRVFSSFHI